MCDSGSEFLSTQASMELGFEKGDPAMYHPNEDAFEKERDLSWKGCWSKRSKLRPS